MALRRAGLLHDIGRVGVSAGIWGKAGALSEREWEQVRLHPYYTERVLARPEPLGRLGALASQHHERLDGSGYHRAAPGQALVARGPHPGRRRRLSGHDRAAAAPSGPRAERSGGRAAPRARAGRLDGDAVHAVLAEAGHQVPRRRRDDRRA